MKLLILLSLSFLLLFADTKEQIKQTSQKIDEVDSSRVEIEKEIEIVGKKIIQESKEKKSLEAELKVLNESLKRLFEQKKNSINELDKFKQTNTKLQQEKKQLEESLATLFSNEFAFDLIQNESKKNSQNIIMSEIFEKFMEIKDEKSSKLVLEYDNISSLIDETSSKISSLEIDIKEYEDKKREQELLTKRQNRLIESLNKSKKEYVARLEQIQKEQKTLRDTLSNLKIIDKKESQAKASSVKEIDQKIKQYGSSYSQSSVKKYRGTKTISPLKNGQIKRKFGRYKDPVYGIDLFNENIVLSSLVPNSSVVAVLPGKVVFAKETLVLNKVVIISHKDGLHTIYGHLWQIPSDIKVGRAIKKGQIIGRVQSDLTFEVTWQKHHINPLDLINLN